MGIDLYSKILLGITLLLTMNYGFSQKSISSQGLAFGAETLIFMPYDGSINSLSESDFEVTSDSFVYGGSVFLDYHFSHNVYVSSSIGIEYLNQPELSYLPLTFGAGIRTSSHKSGFLMEVRMGSHLGDLDSSGFIFRGKFGYYKGFFQKLYFNFGLLYSFQNLNKTFTDSSRQSNYYNLESIGIFLNIKFNKNEK